MQKPFKVLIGSLCALFAVTACSSTGSTGGAPQPPVASTNPDGSTGPARNLIMTDISYLHPSSGDGVTETFNVAASTLTVNVQTVDPAAGTTALVFGESVRGNFADGNTMTYNTDADTFTFNITSGSSSMNEAFRNVMLTDPVDIGLRFNDESIVISSNPYIFGFTQAQADSFLGNPGAVNTFLTNLSESASEADQEAAQAISERVSRLVNNSDFYGYSSNGVNYYHLNLSNGAGTTNYVTLGRWEDRTTTNEITFGAAVFGERTPLSEVPTSGTAKYVAHVEGYLLQNNNVNDLVGTINFNFNFDTDLIDFVYNADIREIGIDGSSDFFDYDVFNGTGSITSDTFNGRFVSQSDSSIIGELEGAFFGADADEIGGTITFGNENVHGVGGFVGANPETTGQQN